MRYLMLIGMLVCLSGCGVKGSSNSMVNGAIKVWEKVWPSDCAAEEAIEDVIEDFTTLDIDLSATTPEE